MGLPGACSQSHKQADALGLDHLDVFEPGFLHLIGDVVGGLADIPPVLRKRTHARDSQERLQLFKQAGLILAHECIDSSRQSGSPLGL